MKRVLLGIMLVAFTIAGIGWMVGTGSSASVDDRNQSAAFRDGVHLGNLAAASGESPHISSGRWATANDRKAFAAGYQKAYQQQLAARSERATGRNSAALHATNAAYRDGLYLGKLYAEEGRPAHISAGRWSTPADRASFTAGYTQAYDTVLLARAELQRNIP